MSDPEHAELVRWMRQRMDEREWTISDLARRVGVQPSMVSRWLRFQRPTSDSVERIANALGGDVNRCLVMAGYPPRERVEDTAEVAHLVAMLRKTPITPERAAMIESLLRTMQARPTER